MSKIDLELELREFNKGVSTAINILNIWDIPEPEIHQGINDNIQFFLDGVLKTIRSGKDISDYELGFFATLKRRNHPELNKILMRFQLQASEQK